MEELKISIEVEKTISFMFFSCWMILGDLEP